MELTEIIAIGAGIIAVILAGIAYHRSGRPITVSGVADALEVSRPLAEQIREVAEVVVAGSQQLKETGKIQTGDEAFAVAMEHLRAWFPGVDPVRFVPFIEAAYYGLRTVVELDRSRQD